MSEPPLEIETVKIDRAALGTRWIACEHEHHDVLGSTNDRAAAWAREPASQAAPHGALVTADAQTAGRGRRGRSWSSPPGVNLYASVVVRPGPLGARLGSVGLAVALGLRDGLAAYADAIRIKWPNDLLIGDRKLAGILCEARWIGDAPELVIGFGINVHAQVFPSDIPAVTLADLGVQPSRDEVLVQVLGPLERALDRFFAHGFTALRDRYVRHAVGVRGPIELASDTRPGERRRVEALGLDHDGALRIREPDGSEQRVETGDVWLVPPR